MDRFRSGAMLPHRITLSLETQHIAGSFWLAYQVSTLTALSRKIANIDTQSNVLLGNSYNHKLEQHKQIRSVE